MYALHRKASRVNLSLSQHLFYKPSLTVSRRASGFTIPNVTLGPRESRVSPSSLTSRSRPSLTLSRIISSPTISHPESSTTDTKEDVFNHLSRLIKQLTEVRRQSPQAEKSKDTSSNLALLIDGDNVSWRFLYGIMLEVPNYGRAIVRRVHGDWTDPKNAGWKTPLQKYSIQPVQQFVNNTGKNVSDGAMIIDAMDLLHENKYDGFCLVSTDTDFTKLAARIREQGATVYGIGARPPSYVTGSNAFVNACDKFVYSDVLDKEGIDVESDDSLPEIKPDLPPKVAARSKPIIQPSKLRPDQALTDPVIRLKANSKARPRPLDRDAIDSIVQAIKQTVADDDDWSDLSTVNNYLLRYSPNLSYRNYRYNKTSDFVEATGLVEFKTVVFRGYNILRVKLKDGHDSLKQSRMRIASEEQSAEDECSSQREQKQDTEDSVPSSDRKDSKMGGVWPKLDSEQRMVKIDSFGHLADKT